MLLKGMRIWVAEIVDIETAFLYGHLDEEVFMKIPEGLHLYQVMKYAEDECFILEHSIYGLAQAARQLFKN